jgi:transcriptional regulator with XRE-family HTH domain
MTLMMLRMDARSTVLADPEGSREEFSGDFGSRLTQLREVRGWKQRELSRRAEIDPGRLSKLERGVARVSVPELIRLSLALGAGLDELVFGATVSLERKWHRLFQELEKAGGPQAVDCATRWLQALVQGYREPALTSPGRPHEVEERHGVR